MRTGAISQCGRRPQTKNGEAVVRAGAAQLIEERHLSSKVLVKEVLALLREAHTDATLLFLFHIS